MKKYLKLIRIKHYLKNILIFLPLIFGQALLNSSKLLSCFIGFISFCLMSSCIYIINDLKDLERDKTHPIKCKRPIASGEVSKNKAKILSVILFVISISLNVLIYYVSRDLKNTIFATGLELLYFLANIFYSFGLKNYPIIDVVILVFGFVDRILYGSVLTNIAISKWLYLTVISGSFYMGFGKRRNEIIKQGDSSRDVLKRYPKEFLDKFMYVCVTLTIVFYSLWCVDDNTIARIGNGYLAITIPIIMVILMKYSLNIENNNSYGDPVDVIVHDKILLVLIGVLAIVMLGILYLL